jgi:hypothetical protein
MQCYLAAYGIMTTQGALQDVTAPGMERSWPAYPKLLDTRTGGCILAY